MAGPPAEELLQAASRLRQWRRGSERAPHKPLLLLLTLGRVQRQRPRLATLGEIENDLRRLLEDFGPPRRRQQPHYPFWHLQSDGLWEVPEGARVAPVTGRGSPPLSDLRPLAGGLPGPLHEQLRADPDLVMRLARRLLDDHFPSSVHRDILERVGLPAEGAAPAARDPGFRLRVLRAYEFRCAVCGYDGRLDTTPVGLEAAHTVACGCLVALKDRSRTLPTGRCPGGQTGRQATRRLVRG